jgi:hypothetical protein
MSFTLAHRAECETIGNWKLVRRTLELESFGVNIVQIAAGEQIPNTTSSTATRRSSSSCSTASRRW